MLAVPCACCFDSRLPTHPPAADLCRSSRGAGRAGAATGRHRLCRRRRLLLWAAALQPGCPAVQLPGLPACCAGGAPAGVAVLGRWWGCGGDVAGRASAGAMCGCRLMPSCYRVLFCLCRQRQHHNTVPAPPPAPPRSMTAGGQAGGTPHAGRLPGPPRTAGVCRGRACRGRCGA